jgi:hypothetical protein
VHLWPYALRHANRALNNPPFPGEATTPIEKFSATNVVPNLEQHHPFRCPAYALDGKVQSGLKAPKWESRARLAINLGPSLQHANSVSLVLSLTTGLVSPQIHVKFDDTFETLSQGAGKIPSNWQYLSGFETQKDHRILDSSVLPKTVHEDVNKFFGRSRCTA